MKEGKPPLTFRRRIEYILLRLERDLLINLINKQVKKSSQPKPNIQPFILFNASTRLGGFSQNAAFNLLTCWGLQVADQPVVHFTCRGGMSRCVLGTNLDDPAEEPPCNICINQSVRLQASTAIQWFTYNQEPKLATALAGLGLDALYSFQWQVDSPDLSFHGEYLPLGEFVLPSLRWVFRRHHLLNNDSSLSTFREFIKSAYQVAVSFDRCLANIQPRAVVVFNGIMFPEAVASFVAKSRGIRVITHEVGFQPFSAFFSEGQATAYPMQIPDSFDLSSEENKRLDEYLSQRFKGEFTMAGIRFWPQMDGLSDVFIKKTSKYKQVVPVFTNVINDTSQVHANFVFTHMFDWLDHVLKVVKTHQDTFFVIRAHPDEKRRGTRKHSREAVSDWIDQNGVKHLSNVIFIDSNEPLSSYEIIRMSKFVLVYNSSIGLEASLLGVPVLCGGKARYTQYPTVFFPRSRNEYQNMMDKFLTTDKIEIPESFQRNARRVMYWQLFKASIPFDDFLCQHPTPGYVQLKRFPWRNLCVDNSPAIQVLVDGIVNGKPFLLPDN